MSDTLHSGKIKLNGRGPIFYIKSEHDVPANVQDAIMSGAVHALEDEHEDAFEHSPVLHVHPQASVGIVSWDPTADKPEDTFEYDIRELDEDWYAEDTYEYDQP